MEKVVLEASLQKNKELVRDGVITQKEADNAHAEFIEIFQALSPYMSQQEMEQGVRNMQQSKVIKCKDDQLVDGLMQNICGHCGKANAKFRCSSCKAMHYCSRQCQSKNWSTHKINCASLEQ